MLEKNCQICKKNHDGNYGSGRFCSVKCANQSRKRNRRRTIARKKKEGTYNKKFNPTTSKLQRNTMNLLHKHGLLHQVQFKVGRYYFDGRFGNILYQVNGTFFHADPRKYKINQVLHHPGKKVLVADIWKKDNKKRLQAYKQGYKVIYIWQDDINKMTQIELVNLVRRRILDATKKIEKASDIE